MIKIKLLLFGPLKEAGNLIELEVPEGTTVKELKLHLHKLLSNMEGLFVSKLAFNCAFALGDNLLDDTAALVSDSELAVLPPVCGG